MKKPLEFKARKETGDDGKETLVIDPICEEIRHPDGRVDMIVHAPSLDLITKFKAENSIT